jgi:hypothetical protein
MRAVRQEIEVDAALDEACRKWSRTEEAWEAITWVLARDPTCGFPLAEGGHARSFVYEGSWAHEMPTIQILYVIEDPYVTIKTALFRDPTTSGGNA